ncbi:MAG: zinc-binding dehydrogenase [Phreatobacter sp.]|uniref:zinc-binding dehydrogenase n=1 Tax=Phreatobacter sp. TaxID=1966341 RepID=UPI001A61332D|nr:zinc-binding dehydrogenase [Phreatobacter sp.]MBL8570285.1 zinc-binding dehydrogenase [Phreatobacter sp.]
MRAMVLKQHGGNEAFEYRTDWPDPTPGPQDAILRVRACTLNYHDVFTRNGMPGIKVPMPIIIGIDIAGDVVAVGSDVRDFKVGDRVLVDPIDRVKGGLTGETYDGGLAEYVRIPVHQLVPLDAAVGYAEAAALPVAYGTAYRMMIARGKVSAGESVLILGASGGVGTCCVQLAKLAGAEVAVCASSDEKLARLAEIGADFGINYATEDFVKACQARFGRARVFQDEGKGIDVVVNFTGGDTWTRSLKVMKRDGRLLTCGATAGYNPPEDIRFIWTFELNIIGSNGWSRQDVVDLLDLVKSGKLKPVLHPERFTLNRAVDAMSVLDKRAVMGKVVVEP